MVVKSFGELLNTSIQNSQWEDLQLIWNLMFRVLRILKKWILFLLELNRFLNLVKKSEMIPFFCWRSRTCWSISNSSENFSFSMLDEYFTFDPSSCIVFVFTVDSQNFRYITVENLRLNDFSIILRYQPKSKNIKVKLEINKTFDSAISQRVKNETK